jgi:hypothetical protein
MLSFGAGVDSVVAALSSPSHSDCHPVAYLRRAARIFHDNDDPVREGRALGNLGVDYHTLGDHAEARACHTAALRIHEPHGDRASAGRAHLGLAKLDDHDGDYDGALRHLLPPCDCSPPSRTATAWSAPSPSSAPTTGSGATSQRHWTWAARPAHWPTNSANASHRPRHTTASEKPLLAAGNRAAAHAEHQRALDISTASGNPREQSRAQAGIARAQQ